MTAYAAQVIPGDVATLLTPPAATVQPVTAVAALIAPVYAAAVVNERPAP